MVPIEWPNSDSAPGAEDSNLRELLQRQANVQLGEVHDKTIIEWIQLSHEYLRDFEEALLRNDQLHAYASFVVATRICYTLIPAHPNYANLSRSERMCDDLLRQKILDNFPEFMRLTVPSIIDRETSHLGVASLSSRRTDRLTPPASPASSTVASIENDHQSFITSDPFLQQYRSDQQSIISADTFVRQQRSIATEKPFATDWDVSANERKQPPPENSLNRDKLLQRHDNENGMTVEDRVIIDDSSVTALRGTLFENLGPESSLHTYQTSSSVAPRIDTPNESDKFRVGHGRYPSASDTMAELYQKINETKISWKNHDTSSISSDDDVDQEPSNIIESSHLFVSNGNIPFTRVGFRDDDTTGIASPTMKNKSKDLYLAQNQARLSDDKIPTMITTTTSTPNSEIFPMDSISRASSISQRGGLVASNEEPLATDFEHLRLTNSNSSHVLQPLEPITLTPQLDDTTINKPDENDGSRTTVTTTTQKPDDVMASNVSTAATAPSIANSDSFDSTHTLRRKSFVDGFWGSKQPKKETSRKKITVQQPPPSSYVQGSTSYYSPFRSIMSSGKSKGKAKKSSKDVSRKESKILQPAVRQAESNHAAEQVENHSLSQPVDKSFERKNRDSISDDDVLPSDTDDRIAASSAHRPSTSSDMTTGSSSVHESSSSHPIPITSQHPSWAENISANVYQGEGILSSSPASYPSTSRAYSSPQSNTLTDFQTPAISPTAHPLIKRLQRYAHTSLECVKYMDFSSLISYANALFAGMRQLESERDYEDAYVQGYMGIIVVTNVLCKHSDRRREKELDFYRFIEISELVNERYKSKLNNIQNILENTHPYP
ncbi:hypothetical protein INT43_004357 [Umbelopsis isabellina]|uniref:Uncharacterized protein n=1 Tax=Mortierella isabellina TaxID=91625 RepID=A0A8H7PIS9_MORIS|nr:hypothetical protein INT43_004357 [Umbelopsis isabellina]